MFIKVYINEKLALKILLVVILKVLKQKNNFLIKKANEVLGQERSLCFYHYHTSSNDCPDYSVKQWL